MKFAGIRKTSLVDYPDRVASTLFTHGCNLRCPYCYNWRLVTEAAGPGLPEETALEVLQMRRRYVDAVVVTGGEPTLHADLPLFLARLKEEGFAVKLDTNGLRPEALSRCLPHVDYVALDVKAPPERYAMLGAGDARGLLASIEILKGGGVDYELRCTAVPGIFDEEGVQRVTELVDGARRFALQQFIPGDTLDKRFSEVAPYPAEVIGRFAEALRSHVGEVILRL